MVNLAKVSAVEKLKLLQAGELTAEENIEFFLQQIAERDKSGEKLNAFLQLNPNALEQAKAIDRKLREGKAGKLAGLAIAVKANINVRGLNANCASLTLKDYISPYDASVIEAIRREDGIVIGITNMDEFACGSSGETSAFGPTKNPHRHELIPGGSSSGSAVAVAACLSDLALGSDTGGSIRNPASHCGVVGVKPSYGMVSRYGLIDLSMSLDQIGPIARHVDDARLLFDVIAGKDERDATTLHDKHDEARKARLAKRPKIALPVVQADEKIITAVQENVYRIAQEVEAEISEIKIDHIDLAVQTYYPLVYVEFFSATRRFDGRRYGERIEEVAGPEVLRRILGGSEISKAEYAGRYYRRALAARALIRQELDKIFEKFDFIIMPTVPRLPHKIGQALSVEEMYAYDSLTVLANLAELPAISIPVAKINGIPVGMQILASRYGDGRLFAFAKRCEEIL